MCLARLTQPLLFIRRFSWVEKLARRSWKSLKVGEQHARKHAGSACAEVLEYAQKAFLVNVNVVSRKTLHPVQQCYDKISETSDAVGGLRASESTISALQTLSTAAQVWRSGRPGQRLVARSRRRDLLFLLSCVGERERPRFKQVTQQNGSR